MNKKNLAVLNNQNLSIKTMLLSVLLGLSACVTDTQGNIEDLMVSEYINQYATLELRNSKLTEKQKDNFIRSIEYLELSQQDLENAKAKLIKDSAFEKLLKKHNFKAEELLPLTFKKIFEMANKKSNGGDLFFFDVNGSHVPMELNSQDLTKKQKRMKAFLIELIELSGIDKNLLKKNKKANQKYDGLFLTAVILLGLGFKFTFFRK